MSAATAPAGAFAGPFLRDPAAELAYRHGARAEELRVNLVVYLVAVTNMLVFLGSDRIFLPPGPTRLALAAGRVGYAALVALVLVLVRRVGSPAARDALHATLSALLMVLSTCIHATRPRGFYLYLPFDIVIAFATWAVLAVSFRWQAALSALALGSSVLVLGAFRDPLSPAGYLAVGMALATVHLIGALTSWHLHRARRAAWLGRQAAEAASREKSVFLGSVSHELLAPLSGLVAAANGLVAGRGAVGPGDEALEALRDEAAALHGLLADVVDLARGEAVAWAAAPQPTAVGSLLADVHHSLSARAAARGIALRRHVEPAVPEALLLDGRRLRQVLLNLASNALRVTDAGEVAVVASAEPAGAGRVTLRVAVRDTGPGMTEAQRAHAFEPFWQAPELPDGRRGAAGLGLAVAAKLTAQLSGRLEVTSRPGAGSTFTLLLPEVEVAHAPEAGAAEGPVDCADPALVEEAGALADVPHAGRAAALAERAEGLARERERPALARWAAEVRGRAEALDAAGLSAVLRRLRRGA